MVKVSIIIPVYNCERFLKDCLDSVINQSCQDFEIILIDDESTDCSGKICDDYAAGNSKIKVIHQKNAGPGFARNTGLELCEGKYYTFVDADDYISQNYIMKMLEMAENNHADIVECGNVYMLEAHNLFKNCNHEQKVLAGQKEISEKRSELRNTVWGRLYLKETFGDIRFTDKKMGEDEEYSNIVLQRCNILVQYNFCLYGYRSYHESITRKHITAKRVNQLGNKSIGYFVQEAESILSVIEHRNEYQISKSALKRLRKLCNRFSDEEHDNLTINNVKKRIEADLLKCQKKHFLICFAYLKSYIVRLFVYAKTLINYKYKLDD